MNILIIGSGGREHALGWKIKQSPLCGNLFFAPGNAGTSMLGNNLPVGAENFDSLKRAIVENEIAMVVVGPEVPLVKGITDELESTPGLSSLVVIGPGMQGAALEGSKRFAKQFMQRHGIPTARYLAVSGSNPANGKEFMKTLPPPYVLKADGLAAGKGVLIINDYDTACLELQNMLGGKFGEASTTVVIEEFLQGIELSVFVLTDGENYLVLPEAKDYKRAGEGDTGLNTGGMGAVSPVPFADKEFMSKIEARVIKPTIKGLKEEGIKYRGFIFFGLIKVKDDPYVIEYNVRLGDPETEAILPRLENDLVELFMALHDGVLHEREIVTSPGFALTTVLASAGYPGIYEKGKSISGLEETGECLIFHAGTALSGGNIISNGGRVVAITGLGESMEKARSNSLKCASLVQFEGKYFRTDIGFDLG